MKILIFGLSISSSWGNGHATLWRGLCRALGERGHHVVFFERDVPYYASTRDMCEMSPGALCLYPSWDDVLPRARRELADADVAIVTSYCADAVAASDLLLSSSVHLRVFYDLDTPVTLSRIARGEPVGYIGARGLGDFDLVLSYTGGSALQQLRERLGARQVEPLYGHVDPAVHHRVAASPEYIADLSYIGTYAEDRHAAFIELFAEPARGLVDSRFVIAGAQYPQDFPWANNIFFVRHLPPSHHPAFYSSSRLTLNVTRQAMAEMGYCPSGRLFEAAACETPIVTDAWEGIDQFFEPGEEILVSRSRDDTLAALQLGDAELRRIAHSARDRVMQQHTSAHRADELIHIFERYSSAAPVA